MEADFAEFRDISKQLETALTDEVTKLEDEHKKLNEEFNNMRLKYTELTDRLQTAQREDASTIVSLQQQVCGEGSMCVDSVQDVIPWARLPCKTWSARQRTTKGYHLVTGTPGPCDTKPACVVEKTF